MQDNNYLIGHLDQANLPLWKIGQSYYLDLSEIFSVTSSLITKKTGLMSLNFILDILPEYNLSNISSLNELVDQSILEFALKVSGSSNKIDEGIIRIFFGKLFGYLIELNIIKFGITRKVFFKQENDPNLNQKQSNIVFGTIYTVLVGY